MRLRHLQATAAVILFCGNVLLGNATGYAAVGEIMKAGKVKQIESDTAAWCGRVKKSIGEAYVPREAETEKDEIKAEVKSQETTAALQNSAAKATEASRAKTTRESTTPVLNQGGSKTVQKNDNAIQTLLTPVKPKDSTATTAAVADNTAVASEQKKTDVTASSCDVSRFTLPADAKSLIVVEGFVVEGSKDTYHETKVSDESRWSKVRVTIFVEDEVGQWQAKIQPAGTYGYSGMSATRHSGDDTIPIGFWETDTPLGRNISEEGFPSDYTHVQAETRRQYWPDRASRLESMAKAAGQKGEKLWEDWTKNIYAYTLNIGFDRDNRQPDTGSASLLRCTSNDKPSTAGCAAIQPEAMKAVLRQCTKGGMHVAQASEGQSGRVYSVFSKSGAVAKGEFKASIEEPPAAETAVLQ